jgi:hypothetical protein
MLQVSELTCPPASTIGIIDDTMLAASVENLDKSVGAASKSVGAAKDPTAATEDGDAAEFVCHLVKPRSRS